MSPVFLNLETIYLDGQATKINGIYELAFSIRLLGEVRWQENELTKNLIRSEKHNSRSRKPTRFESELRKILLCSAFLCVKKKVLIGLRF